MIIAFYMLGGAALKLGMYGSWMKIPFVITSSKLCEPIIGYNAVKLLVSKKTQELLRKIDM